ncbi:MAG: phytoene/squalene synthase family protein [Ignavibacteriaceae bacterium]
MELYHKASFGISKLITREYSTSFSLGIAVFSLVYRNAIYSIYAFVRLADEIVDTFHPHDKTKLLTELRLQTDEALRDGVSTNPVINAFVQTVNHYEIKYEFIKSFLDSMEMDLSNSYYNPKEYSGYIYGSAEVVGLMCLQVFCKKDHELFKRLLSPAKALGSAFQKVNFLRDIRSDIEERGRIYLPGINSFVFIDDESKQKLENDIEKEFEIALKGIKNLPHGVKLGVYSAYLYYRVLFNKIKKLRMKELMKSRVRISNFTKIALLLKSLVEVKLLKTT